MDYPQVAAATRCPQKNIEANWPLIEMCLRDLGILSPAVAIAAIATVAVETAYTFRPIQEEDNKDHTYLKAKKYWPYFGRGFIQITWRDNYKLYGDALGVDLVSEPNLALNPGTAASILAKYFRDHHIQVPAELGNWTRVRELVNGGHNGLAEFLEIVTKLKEIPNEN